MGKYTKPITELGGVKFVDSDHKKEIVTMRNDAHTIEIMVWALGSEDAISSVTIDLKSGKMECYNFNVAN